MTTTRIALAAGICLLASAVRGEEPKFERGTKVLAKSADFVLRDGDKVIRPAPLYALRVEMVDRDRVRLYSDGHEGDANVTEVVCVDDAEAYFSDQIKANRGGVHAYLMRANVRAYQRDLVTAALDCDKAIRLDANNPWIHARRGEILGVQGDFKGAAAEFEEAIKLDQSIAAAYIGRANCHMAEKNYDKALTDLDEAIRRDAHSGFAYAIRGAIWLEKGDGEKALRDLNEAIRINPKSVRRALPTPDTWPRGKSTIKPGPNSIKPFASIPRTAVRTLSERRSLISRAISIVRLRISTSRSGLIHVMSTRWSFVRLA